ncbi:uncharacterized protein I206_106154 [Kwoniella pini CBS 10737]|uniref:Uncharacterized protein n=1 Tax=Kwoniella pini CBS 10737 TaxID=1296096 RepID=A0A1B9I172_9TREE|nr:uncharacterized protein I206_04979 [Kwoniella pini CBS 10737]OCF49290.1 hypothetical protein I206_04979 [Kwoniella pini CBS 10737]
MIRSNPTAIPLRANDIKLLQSEIDKRKANKESTQSTQTQTQMKSTVQTEQDRKNKKSNDDEVFGISEERKDRQGRSVADRIGL